MSKQNNTNEKQYVYNDEGEQLKVYYVSSGEYGRFLQGNQSWDDLVCWETDVDDFISCLEENGFSLTFGDKYSNETLGTDTSSDWYGEYWDGEYQYSEAQAKDRKAIWKKVTYAYEEALGTETIDEAMDILWDAGILCGCSEPFVVGEHTYDDSETTYIEPCDYPDEAYYGKQYED